MPIDRRKLKRDAEYALARERRATAGPFTFDKARPTVTPREVLSLLAELEKAEARIRAAEEVLDEMDSDQHIEWVYDGVRGASAAIRRALDGNAR